MKPTPSATAVNRSSATPHLSKRKRLAEAKAFKGRRPRKAELTPFLELYQYEGSPACHSVRRCLSELGLDYIAHNVTQDDPLKHQAVVDAGGKDQVPLLVDTRSGVTLYQAPAIRAYLENEYGPAEPKTKGITKIARDIDEVIRTRFDRANWELQTQVERLEMMRQNVWGAVHLVADSVRSIRQRFKGTVRQARAKTSPSSRPVGGRARTA